MQAADEALSLIRDGEMARAMRLLHSNGVAGLTARILGQLAQIIMGGVPVGDDDYVHAVLEDKADEIVQYIDKTAAELRNHPHALWASLYYCCQSRFDYWLRHLPPVFTMPHATTPLTMQLSGCLNSSHTMAA